MSSLLQEMLGMNVGLRCSEDCGGGSYEFGFDPSASEKQFFIALLRAPRSHAYSLYNECTPMRSPIPSTQ